MRKIVILLLIIVISLATVSCNILSNVKDNTVSELKKENAKLKEKIEDLTGQLETLEDSLMGEDGNAKKRISLKEVSSILLSKYVSEVHIDGDIAYLAGDGFMSVDVSNKEKPEIISSSKDIQQFVHRLCLYCA